MKRNSFYDGRHADSSFFVSENTSSTDAVLESVDLADRVTCKQSLCRILVREGSCRLTGRMMMPEADDPYTD